MKSGKFYHYEDVILTVKKLNIPVIDLHKELFQKHSDPLSLFPFRSPGHFNELGYKLVAETIFNKIVDYENNNK